MKLLFICKFNRFRSQIAETYFKKINKNKNIQSYSAGVIIGKPIAKSVKDVGKKFGIKISGKPKGINERLLNSTDLVIVVANNVPKRLFFGRGRKVLRWNIKDMDQSDIEGIEKTYKLIINKVDNLNKKLEKNGSN